MAPLVLSACASAADHASYEEAARDTWRGEGPVGGDRASLHRELIRYATRAPSSHNTQGWQFASRGDAISILPDLKRRCPAVDPDDHRLFISLGCAAENLVQAALSHGLSGVVDVDGSRVDAIRMGLEPTKAFASSLFDAIPRRQCTRAEFDGRPLSSEDLRLLERAGTGVGVRMLVLSEKSAMEKVLEYVIVGNSAQMADAAFVAELTAWIRFSDASMVRTISSSNIPAPPEPHRGTWRASSSSTTASSRAAITPREEPWTASGQCAFKVPARSTAARRIGRGP